MKERLHLVSGHNLNQWAEVTEMQILDQWKEEFITDVSKKENEMGYLMKF